MGESLAVCSECGAYFVRVNSKQKRCRICQKEADLTKIKAYNKKKSDQRKKPSQKIKREESTECRVTGSCHYGNHVTGSFCNYFAITGELRGPNHPIKNGRCDLYKKKAKRKKNAPVRLKGSRPAEARA